MARRKRFLDIDVLQAAGERIRHIAMQFDTLTVAFSGGKDSLVTLHLVKEYVDANGGGKVNVIFRDEELIPGTVLDFVNKYRQLPWVNMRYFAVPLLSNKFVLGAVTEYVQWDQNRRHIRPAPEYAITLPPGDNRVFDQYSMDTFAAEGYKGKVAIVNGIRASESLIRYRSAVNKLSDNYINATQDKRLWLCKPIYDWSEDDVFKYLYDHKIEYCPLYDQQAWAGANLRVSTPLHSESAKRIGIWRRIDPVFYDQVLQVFPEMLVQERYWQDFNRQAVIDRYGQSFETVRSYIYDTIQDEHTQRTALEELRSIEARERIRPGSYPMKDVLKFMMGGSFKRRMLPVTRSVNG